MRFFILSDIHSNIEALEACTRRAKLAGYDAVFCCGDIVGYGPHPVEAIDALRELNPLTSSAGIMIESLPVKMTLPSSTRMPGGRSSGPVRPYPIPTASYLASLPVGPLPIDGDAQLVHGAITHEDDYIFTSSDASQNLRLAKRRVTFFGHSHFPAVFASDLHGNAVNPATYEFDEFTAVRCDGNQRFLINPGSVGQPRDGDIRASFLIWDQERERLEFYRVEYPIEKTQAKMWEVQLPPYLIDRLAQGR